MSTKIIFELRVSRVWTETYSTLLQEGAAQAPMAFLGKPDTYAKRYDTERKCISDLDKAWESRIPNWVDSSGLYKTQAQLLRERQEKLGSGDHLTLPWRWPGSNYTHHFWQYYLGNSDPKALSGKKAWQYIIPFISTESVHIDSPRPAESSDECKIFVDSMIYPHGTSVVITARLIFHKGVDVIRILDRAFQSFGELNVRLPDGSGHKVKQDALAIELLSHYRRQMLGEDAPQGQIPSHPLSVATVIGGYGADPSLAIRAGSDLHKVLEGLCSWRSDWNNQSKLAPLENANLLVNKPAEGDIVYHLYRGRAVWMPTLFSTASGPKNHKLGCYHQNLTLVTLQTEMLAQLVKLYMDCLDDIDQRNPSIVPDSLVSLANYAALRLGHLYSASNQVAAKPTYNSASPRFYLDENGFTDIVNRACQSFKKPLPPLKYQQH